MKRLSAITFVVILLLNTMGYYTVFVGIQYNHKIAMVKALDSESYDPAATVTIKIPIAIPYMSDYTEFRRVDGLFEHEGKHYRLVKEKYAQDTLTVVCILDTEETRLDEQVSDYVSTFSDKTGDQPNREKATVDFIKDYLPNYTDLKSLAAGWQKKILFATISERFASSFESSLVHPPPPGLTAHDESAALIESRT